MAHRPEFLKDISQAREFFEQAFRAGHADSAAYLGAFYEYGIEYEMNIPRAYAYYDFAARHGSQEGESMRQRLSKNISPEVADEARSILQELNETTNGVMIY